MTNPGPANGSGPVDGAEIEMATGLSLNDIAMLKTDGSEEVRASIAGKFAGQYDQLHRGKAYQLTDDILQLFSRDASKRVRLAFVRAIKSSRHLPPDVARQLARDDLEIATHILEANPVLNDDDLTAIIQELPETYALVIARRKPLSETITALLIEHKGTAKVVCRLIDNEEAALSEASLAWILAWSETNPLIAEHLQRRPNLPFEITQKHVAALGQRLNWSAITTQSMTKGEASQLTSQIYGSARHQFTRDGKRLNRMLRNLNDRYDAGTLTPFDIIGFLRDRNINLVEFALVVTTKTDLRRVRNLLYGSDKRGLIALCLKAGFSTSEYLTFRMALGLAELAASVDGRGVTYQSTTTEFAKEQFEEMRTDVDQVDGWFEGHHGSQHNDPLGNVG